jgi:hypothetical protein
MRKSWRFVAGPLVLAAAVVLVPRRASPADPVTHPEWARMMLRGLGLGEALEYADTPPRVFAVLSWRQGDWLDATQYIPFSDHGVELEWGAPSLLRASADPGEVSSPVTVARAGEYSLRARMAGEPSAPAAVEVVPLDGGEARTSTLVPALTRGWIEAPRPLRLHPGAYRATLALPRGTVFELLQLAPRCVAPIEPLGGWVKEDVLDAEDLAVTLIRAVDRERELPAADAPLEAEGDEFLVEDGRRGPTAQLEGGTRGARATVSVEVPEDGLYSLSAFGLRTAGQRWAVDGCRTAVTCPLPSRIPTWSVVMTLPLSAGRHRFTVDLGPGDSVDQVRLERRKDTGADYVATLQGMGFDPGEGPVSPEKADEAIEWLGKRHRIELSETCFELGADPVVELVALPPAGPGDPGGPPPTGGPGGPPPTGDPGEPPPTVPCQPPSSPVVPDPCTGP